VRDSRTIPGRLVGVSLKLYLGYAQTEQWLDELRGAAGDLPDGVLFVLPSMPALPAARSLLSGTGVRYGAQNVHFVQSGPYTGEVSPAMVAELGGTLAEVGHAERRAQFGETDEIVARKTAAIAEAGLVPVLCVGEPDRAAGRERFVRGQVREALAGLPPEAPLVVAYEPVWAIGVEEAADAAHVVRMTGAIRAELAGRPGPVSVLYGGSAGPGVFAGFAEAARTADELPDGLFLGRYAHDVGMLRRIADEVLTTPLGGWPEGGPHEWLGMGPCAEEDRGRSAERVTMAAPDGRGAAVPGKALMSMSPVEGASGPYVIGVDCSTTGVKAAVFAADGECVAQGRATLDLAMPHPGWHEQDPRDWWAGTHEALRDAFSRIDSSRVSAISVSHQRESFACLRADGTPLRPAVLWLDSRAGDQVVAHGADWVHELSGKPPDVTPALYKLLWLREHEPSTLDDAKRVVDVACYLTHELTGRWATSWGSADPLGLLDMRTFTWSPKLLALTGLAEEQLPELLEPGAVAGELRPELAGELGLPGPVPVVLSIGDGQAAGLGANVLDADSAYLNLGTAIVSGTHAAEYRFSRAFRTLASPLAGAYTLETLLSSGTYLVRWFVQRFSGDDSGVPDPALQRAAAELPPGADGLLTLPYWNCAQTPHWDPFASGAVIGWRGVHGPAHLYRSLLEAVAFELRVQAEGVHAERGSPIRRYLAMGGGSGSPLWTQMVADVTGSPVTVCADTEITALGAAVQAAAATGLHGGSGHDAVRASAAAMARFSHTVEPGPAAAAYEPMFPIYRKLYGQLAETFAELYQVRVEEAP
jgi:xylulokinase